MEKITIFHAKKTTNKTPHSPYDDNTFVFETYEAKTNLELYSVMVSHFVLNIPLEKLEKPTRTFRRKANLEPYYGKCLNYMILDIDHVKTEFDKQTILEYFKDYRVILGESKSYNGINNFNMKGIIFCDCIPFENAKLALSTIHHDLKDICNIDESVARKASLNAPILKSNIFLNNEDGILLKFVKKEAIEHINEVKAEYIGETPSNGALNCQKQFDKRRKLPNKTREPISQASTYKCTHAHGATRIRTFDQLDAAERDCSKNNDS